MAKLKSNNLELEFLITECLDYDPTEFHFKVTMKWNGIPILNDKAMKRDNDHWEKGAEGGIIGYEIDYIRLIDAIEKSLETREPQFWEAFPDPDVYVSIYPDRSFPYLTEKERGRFAFIVSPDSYQLKDSDCYEGYEGVSFVMNPTEEELRQFIEDLKSEHIAKIKEKIAEITDRLPHSEDKTKRIELLRKAIERFDSE